MLLSAVDWTAATVYVQASAANCYKGCKWSRMLPLVLSQEPQDQSIMTPVLRGLHWLPVQLRITFKTAVLVYKCLQDIMQAHRECGVARASAPGPGGPKGAPSKNLSWCETRWKRAGRNGEVKNCSSDTTCLQLPSGIQDLPRAAGWLSKSQTGPKSAERKEMRLF